ncbi:MAG: TPM domain-containing protein [Lachnospiraceae bacterium]|nr:TPM domain-containing protein [Lachnospiraceae bacterium]
MKTMNINRGKEQHRFILSRPGRSVTGFLFIAALLAVIFLNPAVRASADDQIYQYYENPETGYGVFIHDQADLFSEEEEWALSEKMTGITAYGNVGLATTDYNSSSAESYAHNWLSRYLGTKSSVLFLIDMDNRMLQVQANDGGKDTIGGVITVSYANTITDNVYRYASDGDYYTCSSEVFSQILTLLEGGRISQPMRYICNALLALALGILICYFIANGTSQAKKTTDTEMLMYAVKKFNYTPPVLTYTHTEKKYHPRSSGGGGGGSGGGGGGSHGGGHSF